MAICERLANDGWEIALCDIDELGLKVAQNKFAKRGFIVHTYKLNVTKVESWQELEANLRKQWSQIDLLVNNAGIAASGNIENMSLEHWRNILDVNLWGYIVGSHTFINWLTIDAMRQLAGEFVASIG